MKLLRALDKIILRLIDDTSNLWGLNCCLWLITDNRASRQSAKCQRNYFFMTSLVCPIIQQVFWNGAD